LVVNAIGFIAGVSQNFDMRAAQVFVELQEHAANGTEEFLPRESNLPHRRLLP
jgi:hypothetical protein